MVRSFSWSIARRLTVLYTLSAFGLLSLGTGFLYWALSTNLRAEDDQFLVDILETISTILRQHPGETAPLRVEVEVHWTNQPLLAMQPLVARVPKKSPGNVA